MILTTHVENELSLLNLPLCMAPITSKERGKKASECRLELLSGTGQDS